MIYDLSRDIGMSSPPIYQMILLFVTGALLMARFSQFVRTKSFGMPDILCIFIYPSL